MSSNVTIGRAAYHPAYYFDILLSEFSRLQLPSLSSVLSDEHDNLLMHAYRSSTQSHQQLHHQQIQQKSCCSMQLQDHRGGRHHPVLHQ